jgi:glucans biosynthesis protein
VLRTQRRTFALAAALLVASSAQAAQVPFSHKWLVDHARKLAASGYQPPSEKVPEWVSKLTYDQVRDIRFNPAEAIWKKDPSLPFHLQFFHLGYMVKSGVDVHLVQKGKAKRLPFAASLFNYGKNTPGPVDGLQFAGFRAHYQLNTPEYFDEAITFLGASYFRSLGKGQVYGLSARGLAVDTAEPRGEEFPIFKSFWIEQPGPGAKELVIHALLDSPRVTGAYRFVLRPGQATQVDVSATLFTRKAIDVLGIAPLTSMYLYGENDRLGVDDFRPEVHDSDGVLIWNGNGERLWRPLSNPQKIRVSSFQTEGLKGFGLLQRDQAFVNYEDLESHYERRPSVWIEPLKGWGKGTVRLVELPTDQEIHDNIVAFWIPAEPVKAKAELKFEYRMHWGTGAPKAQVVETVATRIGAGGTPGVPGSGAPGLRKFVVDFSPEAQPHQGESAAVEPVIWTAAGQVHNAVAQRNHATGGWRVFFDFAPGDAEAVEMRCFLRRGDTALSETWSYLWTK